MRPEKSGVPRVPGVPANAHAGLRRNTSKNAGVPGVPKTPSEGDSGNTWNTSQKPRVPSTNPSYMRLEHREHMGTRDLKVGLAMSCKTPAPRPHLTPGQAPADRPGQPLSDIPAAVSGRPLTPAERQRRHRAKKKAEAAARSPSTSAGLLAENMRLVQRVDFLTQERADHKAKAQKSAELAQQLQQDIANDKLRQVELRKVFSTVLPRLSPATRHQISRALKEAGFVAWLDSG